MAVEPDGSDADNDPLVTGRVIIAAGCPALTDATMYISLDDVSYADSSATVVADTVIRHIRHRPERPGEGSEPGGTVVSFALAASPDAAAIDPRHHYAVRIWVDGDGDGRAGPGDLYSDQRYPVLTRGHPSKVTIVLGPGERQVEEKRAPWR
jgi:uncharacterized lipoprotein YbaY